MLLMPTLETKRLLVRPFLLTDLDIAQVLFDQPMTREQQSRWLQRIVMQYEQLAWLDQPPYGERAVVLRETGELVGAVGNVPCLAPFSQIPALYSGNRGTARGMYETEFGLYWAIAPAHRRHGYAAEAARALIGYAFGTLRLARVVATTEYDNAASIGVMRKLGMRVERNTLATPPWLQIVGVLEQPLDA